MDPVKMDKSRQNLLLLFSAVRLHKKTHLPPGGGHLVWPGPMVMTQRPTRLVQRKTRSLGCKDSRDVARAGAFGVLTAFATSLESLHLQLLVPLFTQLVVIFVLIVWPCHTSQSPPGSAGWAQMVQYYPKLHVPNCPQLFQIFPNCSELFLTALYCPQLFQTVPNCFKCTKLYQTVPDFTKLFRTVSNCLKLSQTVPYCSEVFWIVPYYPKLSQSSNFQPSPIRGSLIQAKPIFTHLQAPLVLQLPKSCHIWQAVVTNVHEEFPCSEATEWKTSWSQLRASWNWDVSSPAEEFPLAQLAP